MDSNLWASFGCGLVFRLVLLDLGEGVGANILLKIVLNSFLLSRAFHHLFLKHLFFYCCAL